MVAVGLIVGLFVRFSFVPDPSCASLLLRSAHDVVLHLPESCAQSVAVQTDAVVLSLDKERMRRGLAFKSWIACANVQDDRIQTSFSDDTRWLPSYIPGAFQFRRTVVIVRHFPGAPQQSRVVAEVCFMPWSKYLKQVAGQCGTKFSVWK